MTQEKIETLIIEMAQAYDLDPAIVYGICKQESQFDPFAARFEPRYRWLYNVIDVKPAICSKDTEEILQKTSWGLMQVMGGVYRELGFRGWLTQAAANPAIQLQYGCKHLKKKIDRYGLNEGILAYNAGSPRKDAGGRYVNQYYLNNVLKYAAEFSSMT